MECIQCTTGEHETQDNLERCSFFKTKRKGLDLIIRMHKLIFWRRVTQTLNDIHLNNKDIVNNHTHNIILQQGEIEKYKGTRVSQPNPQGQGEAQSVSDWETCPRGR